MRPVSRAAGQSWTEALLAAISVRTAIIACPQVHWADGGAIDLAAVSEAARRQGAALVLDLTQSLGVMPFDLPRIQPDFAVAASYKWLLGPYTMGFLYVAPHHHEGEPLEQNWIVRDKAEDFARLVDYADRHAPGARRFDMGERSAFQLVTPADICLDLMLGWGADALAQTLGRRCEEIIAACETVGLTTDTPERAAHYLCLTLPAGAPRNLTARLASRGIHASQRGDRLRVTPHVYNEPTDALRLADALRAELA